MNAFPVFPSPMVKPMSPPSAMAPGGPFIPFVPVAMNNMTMPAQGTLVASAAPGQPTKEQVITVYVGKIPAGVEDEFIRKILEYCGKVSAWKRFSDPKTGKFKPFGFCSFDNPLSLVRAKAILNGLKLMGSELMMTVDEKNQKALDSFLIQRKAMLAAARAVSNANKTENVESRDPEEETILDMKAYILALVSRRERNVDWKHVDISVVLQEAKVIRETLSQSSTTTSVTAAETTEKKNSEVEDKEKKEKQEKVDKERDQRRKEREEREFREREKAWEQWEKARDSQRDREKDRERRQQNRAAADLLYDDNERKKRTGDYFQKKRVRDRERQEDLYENQKEQEEKEYQAKKLKEKQQREEEKKEKDNLKIVPSASPFTSSSAMSPTSVSSSPSRSPGPSPSLVTPAPTSFSSSVRVVVPITVNTKKIMMQEPDNHEADDVFTKKKIKLTTLDEGMHKRQKLDNLIKQIPTETDKLFDYPIDWNSIQKFNIVDDKMVPWVAKKVEEYLGSEKSFEQHIIKQLRSRVAPRDFLKQMASVLEDDAEAFCVKLYRKLIFEMLHASLTTEN